ncbi:MAG: hypothetical protein ACJA1A_002856 [Saprospiraceae bacterium]|jgi:hypothetical protein
MLLSNLILLAQTIFAARNELQAPLIADFFAYLEY